MNSLIADFGLASRNLRRNTQRTLVATLTVAFGIVAFLLAGGFIEEVIAASAAPLSPPPAAAGLAPVHREAVRYASRFLLEVLGPDSDMIGAQLEACSAVPQLVAMLGKCREAIRVGAGRRRSEEFWQGVRNFLPDLE